MTQRNGGDNSFSTFPIEFHEKDIVLPIGEKSQYLKSKSNLKLDSKKHFHGQIGFQILHKTMNIK